MLSVLILIARNRTFEFLDLSLRISSVVHVDVLKQCEGHKRHASHDFFQWHFAQQCLCVCCLLEICNASFGCNYSSIGTFVLPFSLL
jgi:hypothetical protein